MDVLKKISITSQFFHFLPLPILFGEYFERDKPNLSLFSFSPSPILFGGYFKDNNHNLLVFPFSPSPSCSMDVLKETIIIPFFLSSFRRCLNHD